MEPDAISWIRPVVYHGPRRKHSASRSYLFVSASVTGAEELYDTANGLLQAGHQVHWGISGASVPTDPGFPSHALDPAHSGSVMRARLASAVSRLSGRRRRAALAAKFDPWFRQTVRAVDAVIATDADAAAMLPIAQHFSQDVLRFGPDEASAVIAEQAAWDSLTPSVAAVASTTRRQLRDEPGLTVDLFRACDDLAGSARLAAVDPRHIYPLLDHLVRSCAPADARRAVEAIGGLPAADDVEPVITGYRTLAELDGEGATSTPVGPAAGAVLGVADTCLEDDDLTGAALLASLALDLLFHRELHSDVPRSDLVDDPVDYLSALRGSVVGRLLTTPVAHPPPDRGEPWAQEGRISVTVLPGPYGTTHTPVLEALRHEHRVQTRVLDLGAEHTTFRTMGTDLSVVTLRLARALGRTMGTAYEAERAELRRSDVVFANWADKGAVLASLEAPANTRLSIRVHSVDALRPWLHLVDWSRVDELICVSAHVGELVQELLGDRLRDTRCHVVPNIIDAQRFDRPKPDDAPRVLCMVGWAQRVKDPLWTLGVLAVLLEHDPRWRLLLIGADFAEALPASGRRYAQRFRERAMADDVRERIEYVGFTDDLPAEVSRAGFVLSSSIRESWPVGVIEAVAAGAVPVIRDWPLFARRHGARRLYPSEWVVSTAEQATERILALSDLRRWSVESQLSRDQVGALTDEDDLGLRYRRIILGEPADLV